MTVSARAAAPAVAATAAVRRRRGFWLRQCRYWHWMSSAICLVSMLGFAATGITLNHASAIGSTPVTTKAHVMLPAAVVAALQPSPAGSQAPLPDIVIAALEGTFGAELAGHDAEWSPDEIYVPLPRPGGDAFVVIDRENGGVDYERTDRGWIAYLNDLHKGRNTGRGWVWFIDIFAAACIVFSATGLVLLQAHAAQRPETWPMLGMGLIIPLLVALLLIH